jgi:hypothetical protein
MGKPRTERYSRSGTAWMDHKALCVPMRADIVERAVKRLQSQGSSSWLKLGTIVRRAVYEVARNPNRGRPPSILVSVKRARKRGVAAIPARANKK